MSSNYLEHANVTVNDPKTSADLLCRVFDWQIRWQGAAMDVGETVHVGNANSYIAFYTQSDVAAKSMNTYKVAGAANHLGIVVDDLQDVRNRVEAEGLSPGELYDYEPGLRFYFFTPDGIEIEVVSYSQATSD